MIISIVVAASDNNVIGKDNKLLWDLPNDMAFFKNITWGMPVIVGRKTFESMANILKGNHVKRGTRLVVFPASTSIYNRALETGVLKTIVQAGGIFNPSSCGAWVPTWSSLQIRPPMHPSTMFC